MNPGRACAQRALEVGGDGSRLLGAVFSPEVPSLLWGPRGRRFLYLICRRPSPSLYAFRFLVGASWSQLRQ